MTSAQGALYAFYVLSVLLCGPPLLSLWICFRRLGRVQRHGRTGHVFLAGIVISAIALPYNFGMTLLTAMSIARGETELGTIHVAAMALAWLCFWIWIAVLVVRLRRPRRRAL